VFSAEPSVVEQCAVVKHRSALPLFWTAATQYLLASQSGPSTFAFRRHKQASLFKAVPSVLLPLAKQSAGLSHLLPVAPFLLHQFSPVQVGPLFPQMQLASFFLSPLSFAHRPEFWHLFPELAAKLQVWFGVQTGAVGSEALTPQVTRSLFTVVPLPWLAEASLGFTHRMFGSLDAVRVSQ
jgi:hypothetical protein